MIVELTFADKRFELAAVYPVRIGADYAPALVADDRLEPRLDKLCGLIQRTIEHEGRGYPADFRRLDRRNRYRSWLYLLRHLRRYDLQILKQIVCDTLGRRLHPIQASFAKRPSS